MKRRNLYLSLLVIILFVITLGSCIKTYSVTFIGFDDVVLKVQKVKKDKNATPPLVPDVEGYTFLKWDNKYNNISKNTNVKAIYEINEYEITFNTFDELFLENQHYEYNEILKLHDNPIKVGYIFIGWYFDEKLNESFDLDKMPSKDITLYAKWEKADDVSIVFDSQIESLGKINVVIPTYQEVEDPFKENEMFFKEGYIFTGWYQSKIGPTRNEQIAKTIPMVTSKSQTLYAIWEPVDSVNVDYDSDAIYTSTINKEGDLNLNPFEYVWEYEREIIELLTSPLYLKDVNWDYAIKEGLANYAGDFSKFEDGKYSIEELQHHYLLIGAAKFPVNENNETIVLDKEFNVDELKTIKGKSWTYEIKSNLAFDDGTKIDNKTYEFSLKGWLDPHQSYKSSDIWHKNFPFGKDNKLLNAYEYANGLASWEEVGFNLDDENPYKFTINLNEYITLEEAIKLIDYLKLVNPNQYLDSFDENTGNYNYGINGYLISSYGPYVIKTIDENEEIILNKNYNYIAKYLVNIKSHKIMFVNDDNELVDLFNDGELSELELNKNNYNQYSDESNILYKPENKSIYLIINQSSSSISDNKLKVLNDKRFRQALLYGLDKNNFASTVLGPSKPGLNLIPNNFKNYIYDIKTYEESLQHTNLIENELNWDIGMYGYNKNLAVLLFEEVYGDWINEGNNGPITLKYIADNYTFDVELHNYIKYTYEKLFEDELGNKRLVIEVNILSSTDNKEILKNLDFDLTLSNLSLNKDDKAWWQYMVLAFIPKEFGTSIFGLNYPQIKTPEGLKLAEYMDKQIVVNFVNTYNYILENDLNDKYSELYQMLNNEGVYKGLLKDLIYYLSKGDTPFDEAFEGASNDLFNLMASLEEVFLDYVPLVPIATIYSAKIYKNNVINSWPVFSNVFGYGNQSYWYLKTDPDFNNMWNLVYI